MKNPNELLTRKQLVEEYGFGQRWLELAATRGDGPPMVNLGWKTRRYRRGDVEEYIRSRTVRSTAEKVAG